MYLLARLFLFLTHAPEQFARDRAQAYLADATDLCDLESRIRKLDRVGALEYSPWWAKQ